MSLLLPLLFLLVAVIAITAKMPPASQGAYWDKHGNELCLTCHELVGLHEEKRACPTQQELPF
jgi:hypothetical protein